MDGSEICQRRAPFSASDDQNPARGAPPEGGERRGAGATGPAGGQPWKGVDSTPAGSPQAGGAGAQPAGATQTGAPRTEERSTDRVLRERSRLSVLTVLATAPGGTLGFTELQEKATLSAGNLSSHMRKLEAAEYVTVRKGFRGRRPYTTVAITQAGRTALEKHVAELERIVQQYREGGGGTGTSTGSDVGSDAGTSTGAGGREVRHAE